MNTFSPHGAETCDIKLATTRRRCWVCPRPADTSWLPGAEGGQPNGRAKGAVHPLGAETQRGTTDAR